VKFIIDNWMLISIAVASGGLLLWPLLQGVATAGLSPAGAVQMINREKAVVVDVCEAAEFAAGHVTGSKNVPLSTLESKLGGVVKNKTVPLILVCQSGARSGRAVQIAKKLGYQQVLSLGGGLAAWKEANLPVEKLQA
jgi:rhodanese-related sulfurtransferase